MEVLNERYLKDEYERVFETREELYENVKEIEEHSEWVPDCSTSRITFSSVLPLEAPETAAKLNIDADALYDTADRGTGLVLSYDRHYPVRKSAIDSILSSAKMNGSALGKLSAYNLAEVLNRCIAVARGSSLIYNSCGKLAACLSSEYVIMRISELLDITERVLKEKFGKVEFKLGYNSHEFTSAFYEIPDCPDLIESYKKATAKSKHMHGVNFTPCVEFFTSNVGKSAATLMPCYKMTNGAVFRINDGIRVEHKLREKCGIELFESETDRIYSRFSDLEKTLTAMANTYITYPLNALVGMCKKSRNS